MDPVGRARGVFTAAAGAAAPRGVRLALALVACVALLGAAVAMVDFRQHAAGVDLVVTDHMMPGMDGFQLAAAMHAVRPELAILLTSGNALAFSPDTVEMRNLRGLLPKPSSTEELAQAVRRALAPIPR